ncbi:MAG: universal stress protein [Acidimicrobiia bacterium]|nr:universal stress protein [Acidimicrobiia bacterium]MBA3983431.1 universal stress protein [Acidimicrobiia bacterium]
MMTVYVVGTDGSDTAAKAGERTAELALATGASIHVVCAFTRRGATTVGLGSDVFTISEIAEAEQIAEQQAAIYRAAGITATVSACEGKPAAAILEEAERVEADMIVVGNRRMQGVQRVLGAVANDVAHHAPCDVLVVKTV